MKERKLIGEILMEMKAVTQEQLEECLEEQKKSSNFRIGKVLVNKSYTDEVRIAEALAKQFELGFCDMKDFKVKPNFTAEFNRKAMREFKFMPRAKISDEDGDPMAALIIYDPTDIRTSIIQMAALPYQVKFEVGPKSVLIKTIEDYLESTKRPEVEIDTEAETKTEVKVKAEAEAEK